MAPIGAQRPSFFSSHTKLGTVLSNLCLRYTWDRILKHIANRRKFCNMASVYCSLAKKKPQRPIFIANLTSSALLEIVEIGSDSMLLPLHLGRQHLCNHSHRNPKLWLVRALEQGQPQAFNDRPSIIPRRSSSSSSWIWHHEHDQFDHDDHHHNIHLDHLYHHYY